MKTCRRCGTEYTISRCPPCRSKASKGWAKKKRTPKGPQTIASWPIIDATVPEADLIAQAADELHTLIPDGYHVRSVAYAVRDGHVIATGYARRKPSNRPSGHMEPRLPVEPVLGLLEGRLANDWWAQKAIERAKVEGGLTYAAADRLACKVLGLHPCEVWPEWFEEVA